MAIHLAYRETYVRGESTAVTFPATTEPRIAIQLNGIQPGLDWIKMESKHWNYVLNPGSRVER
jgi:hypothetical protein